jgi:hypothetical protein
VFASPILLTITTASSFVLLLSEPVEKGLIVSALVLGTANLSGSWWRSHHRPECLVLFVIGMALVLLHDRIPGVLISASVSVAGGLLIGAAHFRNMQLLAQMRLLPGCCKMISCKETQGACERE